MRVANLILLSTHEARSLSSYERDIVLLNSLLDVGDQHHLRKFPAEFINTMAEIIALQLSSVIKTTLCTGTFSPVSLSGDKVTMKGLTMQPVGLSTILLSLEYFKGEFYI